MSEKRTPWPGETLRQAQDAAAARYEPPDPNDVTVHPYIKELMDRIAALEQAARAVVEARWSDERLKAIEALGRVVGEN